MRITDWQHDESRLIGMKRRGQNKCAQCGEQLSDAEMLACKAFCKNCVQQQRIRTAIKMSGMKNSGR